MKRIKYPQRSSREFDDLKTNYKAIYATHELQTMEDGWTNWKLRNNVTNIPETVEQLIVADVDALADVYDRFVQLTQVQEKVVNASTGEKKRSQEYKELDKIFRYYNHYDSRIAKFFHKYADELSICSCHYCELAYVNTYQVTVSGRAMVRQHFDVDHYLPKTHCPILGLSLFNFVPSCQVCNSRIKSDHVIGANKVEWAKFSPVSENYEFEDNVKIRLRMHRGPNTAFKEKTEYYIYFRCKNGFREPVNFFHLEERYEFHKPEAMRIKQLKARYPQSARRKIARLLGCTEARVREDLFHEHFLKDNERCFAKLTSDMLK